MANVFLAWQNRTDTSVLSGGSWVSSLPITNMQNRQIQKVARTSDASLSSTQFLVDCQAPRPIGVIALVNHNIGVSGQIKIIGASSPSAFTNLFTTYTNDFSNAVWTKGNVSVTPNSTVAIAPDGSNTASQILGTATTNAYVLRDVSLSGTSTISETVYLRAGSQSQATAKITWYGGTAQQNASCAIDLLTGVVSSVSGTASSISAFAVDVGDGWWRVTITGTGTNATNTTARLEFAVVGGKSIFAWGARLAVGAPPVYESAFIDVWPAGVVPQAMLEWENDNFWTGSLSEELREGFQSPFILRLPEVRLGQHWKVEVFDTANPDGYVQIGRLFMAQGWSPSVNYVYGAGIAYGDPTPIEMSLSGAEYFDIRPKYRLMEFALDYISETEAYSYALELQRIAGISGEVLVIPDGGDDVSQQPLRSFVGRLRQLGSVKQPQPSAYSVNFEIKELL